MKIVKKIKIIKYIIINLSLTSNFLFSTGLWIDNSLDEVSKIIYQPKIINDFIKYPYLIKNFSISGTSTALFIVSKEGKIEDIKIEKSLGIAFDRQIFDGLNKISAEILQKKRYKTDNIYRLSVYFKN